MKEIRIRLRTYFRNVTLFWFGWKILVENKISSILYVRFLRRKMDIAKSKHKHVSFSRALLSSIGFGHRPNSPPDDSVGSQSFPLNSLSLCYQRYFPSFHLFLNLPQDPTYTWGSFTYLFVSKYPSFSCSPYI